MDSDHTGYSRANKGARGSFCVVGVDDPIEIINIGRHLATNQPRLKRRPLAVAGWLGRVSAGHVRRAPAIMVCSGSESC